MRWLVGVVTVVLTSSSPVTGLTAEHVVPGDFSPPIVTWVVDGDYELPADADHSGRGPVGLVVTSVDDHTIELYIAD